MGVQRDRALPRGKARRRHALSERSQATGRLGSLDGLGVEPPRACHYARVLGIDPHSRRQAQHGADHRRRREDSATVPGARAGPRRQGLRCREELHDGRHNRRRVRVSLVRARREAPDPAAGRGLLRAHTQLPDAISLARAFPDTTIVLDHFGGPLGIGPYAGKQDEVFATWKTQIDELARCPNVVAKLGGLNMEVNGYGWEHRPLPPTSAELAQATRRYFEHTIDRFGAKRCMFESNFPVDKLSCSYTVLWNSFKRFSKGYSADERADLFYGTAARVYRL